MSFLIQKMLQCEIEEDIEEIITNRLERGMNVQDALE